MQGLVALEPRLSLMTQMRGSEELATGALVGRFTDVIVAGLRNQSPAS
jgi:hypothetical protein